MRAVWLAAIVALGALGAAPAHAQIRTIVIDAGHGGSDPGAGGNNLQEKAVALDVALRFRALLEAAHADPAGGGQWKVLLTRADDATVSLAARSAYANAQGADRFLSIHCNSFSNATANGIETFSRTDTGTAAMLRNLVQAEAVAAWGLVNRGNKTANFAVLRETNAPAILHELGFITNATDAGKLGSPAARQDAAIAHLVALQRHYGITPHVPGEPPAALLGRIEGVVVSAAGPVAGATVQLGERAVETDAAGGFAFPEIEPGEHALDVSAPGFLAGGAPAVVAAGETTWLEIVIDAERGDETPAPPTDEVGAGCAASPAGAAGDAAGALGGVLVGIAALSARRRRRPS